MCGACGTGVAAAPWESQVMPAGISGRRELVGAVQAAFPESRRRVQVNHFGIGFLISGRSGGARVANGIDEVIDDLRRDSPALVKPLTADSSLATIVVALSCARHDGERVKHLFSAEGIMMHVRVDDGVVHITRGDRVEPADSASHRFADLASVSAV